MQIEYLKGVFQQRGKLNLVPPLAELRGPFSRKKYINTSFGLIYRETGGALIKRASARAVEPRSRPRRPRLPRLRLRADCYHLAFLHSKRVHLFLNHLACERSRYRFIIDLRAGVAGLSGPRNISSQGRAISEFLTRRCSLDTPQPESGATAPRSSSATPHL
jgi:hypothetical protein